MTDAFNLGKSVGRAQIKLHDLKEAEARIRELEARLREVEEARRAAFKHASEAEDLALAAEGYFEPCWECQGLGWQTKHKRRWPWRRS